MGSDRDDKDCQRIENHYSHTKHYPKTNAVKKLDDENVYHVLEGPAPEGEEGEEQG